MMGAGTTPSEHAGRRACVCVGAHAHACVYIYIDIYFYILTMHEPMNVKFKRMKSQ